MTEKGNTTFKEPKVSVIITAYNSREYICRAIDSVFNQTSKSHETIIVDDGSTDDTESLLSAYEKRVRYVRQENAGVAKARNQGLQLAKGDYLVFLDADDVLLKTKLTRQGAFLDERPELGYVHSGWRLIDGEDRFIGSIEPWRQSPRLDLEGWLLWHPVFLGATMFRRRWVEQAAGFDPSLRQAEDTDFFLRLALMGCPADWLQEPTVCYRQHDQGLTHNCRERSKWVHYVIDRFFSRSDIPEHIHGLEKEIRNNIVMWSVWELYQSGYWSELTEYLRQSVRYSDVSPARTVQSWLGRLVARCRQVEGCRIEDLRSLWPCFRAAIEVDASQWQGIEKFLDWILQSNSRVRTQG